MKRAQEEINAQLFAISQGCLDLTDEQIEASTKRWMSMLKAQEDLVSMTIKDLRKKNNGKTHNYR